MATPGSDTRVGVVLAAVDEFSAATAKFTQAMQNVAGAEAKASAASQQSQRSTAALGDTHRIGAEKMARYAIGASILTGQLQQMGIGADKAMLPLTILFTTLTEGFNPTGMIVLGVGTLTSAILNMATAERQAKDAFLAGGAQLEQLADKTNTHSALVQQLTDRYHALTRAKIADLQADLLKQQAGELSLWQNIKMGIAGGVDALTGWTLGATTAKGIAQEHATALQKLETQILQLQLSLTYETDEQKKSNEARQRAIDLARQQAADYARQLDDVATGIAAHDDAAQKKLVDNRKVSADKIVAYQRAAAAQSIATFDATTDAAQASADAQTDAQRRAAVEQRSIQEQQAAFYLQSAAQIGAALGAAAMGQVGAWKAAAFAVLAIVKKQVEVALGITALLNPLNLLKVAGVEALFTAGNAVLAGMGGSPSTAAGSPSYGSPSYSGGGTLSYGGGGGTTYYAAPSVSIVQHINGDVSPQTRQAVREDVQRVLDRELPKWQQRQARRGRAA